MGHKAFLTGILMCCALSISACDEFPGSSRSKAHDAVREVLVDGDSAKFRDEAVSKIGAVCGFVNAKNRMGGYVGFSPYIYTGGVGGTTGMVMISPGPPKFDDYFDYEDNQFIRSDAIDQISNACSFATSWTIWCEEVKRPELASMIESCSYWKKGQAGMDELRKKLRGY